MIGHTIKKRVLGVGAACGWLLITTAFSQSLEINGDLKTTNKTRIVSGSGSDYWAQKSTSGYGYDPGIYHRLDASYGGMEFKDPFGNPILFLGMASSNYGKTGIGTVSPTEKMEVSGVTAYGAVSAPSAASGKAKIWGETLSGTTEMRVKDSAGNATTISPHRFDLFQPSAADPLPWAYYSENTFIGKKVNVDMSGAIRELERLSGKQFIHIADLPADQIIKIEDWKASETIRLVLEAKVREMENDPWVEIPFAEAYEEIEDMETRVEKVNVTKYRINWDTMQVEPYQVVEDKVTHVNTNRKVPVLKLNVRFDENTGKCYRRKTPEDIAQAPSVGEVAVPDYVAARATAR